MRNHGDCCEDFSEFFSADRSQAEGNTVHIGYQIAETFPREELALHFGKHAAPFGAESERDYKVRAFSCANTIGARGSCLSFVDRRGVTFKFDRNRRSLVLVAETGEILSFFKTDEARFRKYFAHETADRKAPPTDFSRYTPMLCPICGGFFFSAPAGFERELGASFQCRECGWRYDFAQTVHPELEHGANELSREDFCSEYCERLDENTRYRYLKAAFPDRPHACPVCGKHEFPAKGSFGVCPECGWEDDPLMEDSPEETGGANELCLAEYKKRHEERLRENPGFRWAKDGFPGAGREPAREAPHACPVCGKTVFSSEDSDERCPECGWINSIAMEETPDALEGCPNPCSLNDFRAAYRDMLREDPDFRWANFCGPEEGDDGAGYEPEPHPCPVCGKYEFPDANSFDICSECGWEDEFVFDPDEGGGANGLSLNAFKERYEETVRQNPDFKWKRDGYPGEPKYDDDDGEAEDGGK